MSIDNPASVQRRLAAILCADVEGYTRLMRADEAATLRLLGSCREITDRLIATYAGRIANTAGDSILAEFPSAMDGLQCALEIQDRVAALNDEVPEERRVTFRTGLHVGEVTVRNGDLFGDSVNVAARLQALAPPGTVCLSETAHQFTSASANVSFEDLGLQLVKNLEAPVRAYSARSASRVRAEGIPSIHRVEAHLARRFYDLSHAAMVKVTSTEDLSPREYGALAALDDAPRLNAEHLADRLGAPLAEAVSSSRGLSRAVLWSRAGMLRLS